MVQIHSLYLMVVNTKAAYGRYTKRPPSTQFTKKKQQQHYFLVSCLVDTKRPFGPHTTAKHSLKAIPVIKRKIKQSPIVHRLNPPTNNEEAALKALLRSAITTASSLLVGGPRGAGDPPPGTARHEQEIFYRPLSSPFYQLFQHK